MFEMIKLNLFCTLYSTSCLQKSYESIDITLYSSYSVYLSFYDSLSSLLKLFLNLVLPLFSAFIPFCCIAISFVPSVLIQYEVLQNISFMFYCECLQNFLSCLLLLFLNIVLLFSAFLSSCLLCLLLFFDARFLLFSLFSFNMQFYEQFLCVF